MKFFLYFGLLFTLISCRCMDPDIEGKLYDNSNFDYNQGVNEEFCFNKNLDAEETALGVRCCYMQLVNCQYEDGEEDETYHKNFEGCVSVSKKEYGLLSEAIKEKKKQCKDFKINCP